jgi:hypothetical protein
VELLPLDSFVLADFNPKQHDLAAIMESLDRFGFGNPLIQDGRTGKLIGGHGRLEGLRMMRDEGFDPPAGIDDAWRVPVYTGWSSRDDEEALAFGLALNKTQDAGGWDDQGLAELLRDLGEDKARIGLGIAEAELQAALGNQQSASAGDSPASAGSDPGVRRIVLTGDALWHRRMVEYLRAAAAELGDGVGTVGELCERVLEEAYS